VCGVYCSVSRCNDLPRGCNPHLAWCFTTMREHWSRQAHILVSSFIIMGRRFLRSAIAGRQCHCIHRLESKWEIHHPSHAGNLSTLEHLKCIRFNRSFYSYLNDFWSATKIFVASFVGGRGRLRDPIGEEMKTQLASWWSEPFSGYWSLQ